MQQSSGSFRLIVRRGPQPNQIYELNKDIITIGRDITNEITINDPECSRHHSRLTRDPNGFIIEDLGSTNGTFVNGQRLTGARLLVPGETVGLGETVTLAYEATTFAAPPAPAYAPPAAPDYAPPKETASKPPAAYTPPPPSQPPVGSPYAPQPPASPYAPQPPYAQAPAPYGAPPYDPYAQQAPYGYEEESSGGGMTRWLLLGCGCFIVLCVLGAVLGVIVIDQTCAWEQEPFSSLVDVFGLEANQADSACQ